MSMTKSEAIKFLSRYVGNDYYTPQCQEAHGMAIEAIRQVEELKKELIDERYRHDRYVDFELAEAEELQKLKEERRWIPVTERLPDTVPSGAGTEYEGEYHRYNWNCCPVCGSKMDMEKAE